MVPDDPQHPGRLPVLGRRRLQERGGALGRRAQPAGAGQDAAQRRATCCCSTSPRTTSTSTPRRSCSRRSRDYGGTLVFVSHDRYFVDKLADQGDRGRRRRGARSTPAATRTSSTGRSSGRPASPPFRPEPRARDHRSPCTPLPGARTTTGRRRSPPGRRSRLPRNRAPRQLRLPRRLRARRSTRSRRGRPPLQPRPRRSRTRSPRGCDRRARLPSARRSSAR